MNANYPRLIAADAAAEKANEIMIDKTNIKSENAVPDDIQKPFSN